MDSLPPELQLKIARKCDFATANTLSKLNKRWERLISSNWNSLEKLHVERIELKYIDEKKELSVYCEFRLGDGRNKTLALKLGQGFEELNSDVALECAWQFDESEPTEFTFRPKDTDAFLFDLFEPIFRKSTIHQLKLDFQKSSTLLSFIVLLKQHRTSIYQLSLGLGSPKSAGKFRELQQLSSAAEIVQLAKPTILVLVIESEPSNVEVRQHFLLKIARQKITHFSMVCDGDWDNLHNTSNKEGREVSAAGNSEQTSSTLNESKAILPLPRCRILNWLGLFGKIAVSDLNELIKEWCYDSREIFRYGFLCGLKFDEAAAEFEETLRGSNLPIRIVTVREKGKYRIEKMEKCGNEQDELSIEFTNSEEIPRSVLTSYDGHYALVQINSRHGLSPEQLSIDNFEKCRFC